MDKINPAIGVFKDPAKTRRERAKKRRADIAAKDRRILAAGIPTIPPNKVRGVWNAAFPNHLLGCSPDHRLGCAVAERLVYDSATAACNAAGKIPREAERRFVKMERLLLETREMFPEDYKGEEWSKQPHDLVVDEGSVTAAAARDWIAELESVVTRAKRRHSVACKFQEEAVGGPHRVFVLHLYRAVKRFGLDLKLSRDVETGKFNGPFVKFACEAWALCFPGASQMPPRTVEAVMRGRGAFPLQWLPENSHPPQFTDGCG